MKKQRVLALCRAKMVFFSCKQKNNLSTDAIGIAIAAFIFKNLKSSWRLVCNS